MQYFDNMRHDSVAPDTFGEVVKEMSSAGLKDTELAWYFLGASRWI